MAKQQKYTYDAWPAGKDPEGKPQWRGSCKEYDKLTVLEETEQAALDGIKEAHRDLLADMQKWGER